MIHTIQSDIAQQFSPVLDITTGTQYSNKSIYLSNNDKAYNTPPVMEGNLQLCWSVHGGVSLELPKRIESNKLYTWARELMPRVCHYLSPPFSFFFFIFDRFLFCICVLKVYCVLKRIWYIWIQWIVIRVSCEYLSYILAVTVIFLMCLYMRSCVFWSDFINIYNIIVVII